MHRTSIEHLDFGFNLVQTSTGLVECFKNICYSTYKVCLHLDILKIFISCTKFSKSARDMLLSLT